MDKLKSRKFLLTLGGSLLALVAPTLGIPEPVVSLALKLVGLYVGVEGALDFAALYQAGKRLAETGGSDDPKS